MIRVILFDAMGTVIYPDPPVADAYHRWGCRYGSRLSRAEISARFRQSFRRHYADAVAAANDWRTSQADEERCWRAVVADVFADQPCPQEPLFRALWQHFAQGKHWRVYADVIGVWRQLEARGLLVGLASNFDDRLLSLCQTLAPLDTCPVVFCSAQLGARKPGLEFFRRIEQQLGVPSEQILLVGDDPIADVAGARQAGWQAVLIRRDSQASGLPHWPNLEPLIGWIDQLADS